MSESKADRRDFLVKLGIGAGAVGIATQAGASLRSLLPNVSYDAPTTVNRPTNARRLNRPPTVCACIDPRILPHPRPQPVSKHPQDYVFARAGRRNKQSAAPRGTALRRSV